MTADLTPLRDADAGGARRFLSEVEPGAFVQAVTGTGDDDLLALFSRPEIRGAAVTTLLDRLHELAVPTRMAELHGVVRFDLRRRRELLERHALQFDEGHLTVQPDAADDESADVVLTTSLLRFLRLISGEANAGLLYLGGKLDIAGDADLALGVSGIFRVPGTDHVAVDPTELDPVDVATVLKGVSQEHLRAVLASGFRPVVLGEIFRRLPEFVNERRARRLRLSVGFRLLGNPVGEAERYVVTLAGGRAEVDVGEPGGHRDATVTCQGSDFLRLATGHLNPVVGVLKGQLKVKGDRAKALALASALDIPQAR